MARYFNGKEVELLAPAGTFDIFETVIRTNCDAVYFGGPSLNMRMMRKGYNLSYEEINQAISIAHSLGKRVYITLNNLVNETDMDDARQYLQFIHEAQPDAIIVQDFAILSLIRDMGLDIKVHSSVMMNVHNLEMIRFLAELGVTRVVASREMDLQTARYLQAKTGMEFEYFVHGDMCTVHGANCHFSSMLFGMSSNRGQCMKPCRWDYRVKKDGFIYPTEYPLAAKDMNLYEYIPELIESGITSFKIEGRMRDKEFVTMLINSYGDAIDRYIADPIGYNRSQNSEEIFDNRKRDFSTAYAFGKPGLSYINRRYEGTGKFYSTGKVFSTPTPERSIQEERLNEVKSAVSTVQRPSSAPADLSIRVNNAAQAKVAIEEGVEHIYLAGDVYAPDRPFTKQEIIELTAMKGSSNIYLGLPRMMTELQFEQYAQLLETSDLGIDGIVVTNVGAMHKFRHLGLKMIGDYNLNISNNQAAMFYQQHGLERFTSSIELPLQHFTELLEHNNVPMEVVVHGTPVVMYLELDLYDNTEVFDPIGEEENKYVHNQHLVLMTDKGENPVYRDQYGRNHLTTAKEICYLPLLQELLQAGVRHFRIEGSTYAVDSLRKIIRTYRQALQSPVQSAALYTELPPVYAGYTLGTLSFGQVAQEAEPVEAVLQK
ncbi:peptidase U32 [Paenibacillus selenitireducens]|uniref:Peptidase U32 n=1 Tax=Paenibacillus selenitireducens TaxID=1324314 RepID=A0A1T2XAU0_9BACL|nr:U32 family peptidase [Paenibacillus selenitireducens]OPA76955.1 peptidase U32 [Paenibacillus selenitireducens]